MRNADIHAVLKRSELGHRLTADVVKRCATALQHKTAPSAQLWAVLQPLMESSPFSLYALNAHRYLLRMAPHTSRPATALPEASSRASVKEPA